MSVSCAIPSIHGVESLQASVMEFQGSYCLRLRLGELDTLSIWFDGPNARARVDAYADAINTTNRLPAALGDLAVGASA